MMRKGIGWVLVPLVTFLTLSYGTCLAQQAEGKKGIALIPTDQLITRVVEIRGEKGLVPKTVASGKGTTVIWYNATNGPVRIRFDRGDQVRLACTDPLHFALQSDSTFQSEEIPFGGTASLCFVEPGEYAYTLTGAKVKAYPTQQDVMETGTVLIK